mmetsp:Transcript_19144/g.47773  ORF Transcript_19144/g.47773 Transcript_19144/m.47773 type:complete len:357 (-) Transcript_19144:3375-4445(-)
MFIFARSCSALAFLACASAMESRPRPVISSSRTPPTSSLMRSMKMCASISGGNMTMLNMHRRTVTRPSRNLRLTMSRASPPLMVVPAYVVTGPPLEKEMSNLSAHTASRMGFTAVMIFTAVGHLPSRVSISRPMEKLRRIRRNATPSCLMTSASLITRGSVPYGALAHFILLISAMKLLSMTSFTSASSSSSPGGEAGAGGGAVGLTPTALASFRFPMGTTSFPAHPTMPPSISNMLGTMKGGANVTVKPMPRPMGKMIPRLGICFMGFNQICDSALSDAASMISSEKPESESDMRNSALPTIVTFSSRMLLSGLLLMTKSASAAMLTPMDRDPVHFTNSPNSIVLIPVVFSSSRL